MENSTITEYVRRYPEVDRINLVSGFVSAVANLIRAPNSTDVGRGRRPSLPPLAQRDPWGFKGRKSFDSFFVILLGARN